MRHVLKDTEYLTHDDVNGEIACTPFKYPDGEFFEDEEDKLKIFKQIIYDSFIKALGELGEKERIIVITRLLKSDLSLRDIASNINMSHEYVRKRLNKVNKIYPSLYKKIVKNLKTIQDVNEKGLTTRD